MYALREDRKVYCFKMATAAIVTVTAVTEGDPSALVVHPHRNLVGTLATDGKLVLWKAPGSGRR